MPPTDPRTTRSNRGLRVLRFDTLAARRGNPCHIREARHPDFPERPPCLTTAFTDDLHKAQQLRFFVARKQLLIDEPELPTVIREISVIIMAAVRGAIDGDHMPGRRSQESG